MTFGYLYRRQVDFISNNLKIKYIFILTTSKKTKYIFTTSLNKKRNLVSNSVSVSLYLTNSFFYLFEIFKHNILRINYARKYIFIDIFFRILRYLLLYIYITFYLLDYFILFLITTLKHSFSLLFLFIYVTYFNVLICSLCSILRSPL